MWHVHPFSQRNKTSKIAGREGWKQRKEVLDKILKRWGRQYRGSSQQGVLGTLR